MARRLQKLTLLTFSTLGAPAFLLAQDPAAAPSPQPTVRSAPRNSPTVATPGQQNKPWKKPDDFEEARHYFEQLAPEKKQQLRENFERWKNMPPEERDAMRDREHFRHEKIAQEIDESVHKSGLQLDADQREVYALRYTQERRKIEEQLRREMEAKRRPMMQRMLERLKTEFSKPSPSPSASPSPAAAASPSAKP